MLKLTSTAWAGALAVTVVIGAPPARAEKVSLEGVLSGKYENPANASKASGRMSGVYDTATKVLTYRITHRGLSGPATAAHFHGPATANQNAGVALGFQNAQSPIRGQATLTDAQAKQLLEGAWYANIHTAASPGGEIRGQVRPHVYEPVRNRARKDAKEVPITRDLNAMQMPK